MVRIIISEAHYLAHTAPLFYNLNTLDIFNVNAFLVACFLNSYHNDYNLFPITFDNLFCNNHQVHTYNIGNANKLLLPSLLQK